MQLTPEGACGGPKQAAWLEAARTKGRLVEHFLPVVDAGLVLFDLLNLHSHESLGGFVSKADLQELKLSKK
jgi:hypothetical protein